MSNNLILKDKFKKKSKKYQSQIELIFEIRDLYETEITPKKINTKK
jgi:hypothetical protein